MVIGEYIKRERQKRNWTQADLAKKAGVTASMLCRVEKNHVDDPGFHTVAKIAKKLGLSLDMLADFGADTNLSRPAMSLCS